MPALLSAIGWMVAKIFGDNVLRFVAGKAMLTALFMVVLPIVLNNLIYDIMDLSMSLVDGKTDASTMNGFHGAMSFDGLAGWILGCFQVSQCIAVIVSAIILKVTLKMIPFVRL